ncbi:MAG TPA: hypothetical protein VG965_02470 [Patescibacteria group bacterium]|nr:hypothetical protein [Patescibacteria group bacterium]
MKTIEFTHDTTPEIVKDLIDLLTDHKFTYAKQVQIANFRSTLTLQVKRYLTEPKVTYRSASETDVAGGEQITVHFNEGDWEINDKWRGNGLPRFIFEDDRVTVQYFEHGYLAQAIFAIED